MAIDWGKAWDVAKRVGLGAATGGLSEVARAGIGAVKQDIGSPADIRNAPQQFAATGNTLKLPGVSDPGQFQASYASPGQYQGGSQQVAYANEIAQGLGINPAQTSAAINAAGQAKLNQGMHERDVANAANVSRQGIAGSGTAAALASRAGTDYASASADLAMKAQQEQADRAFQQQSFLAGLGQQQAQSAGQFGLRAAGEQNRFGLAQADYGLARANALNTYGADKARDEWGANVGLPMSMEAARQAGKRDMYGNIISGGLGALGAAFGA